MSATNEQVLRAQLSEAQAENEYLRNRNAQLSVAIQKLAQQVADLTPEAEESDENAAEV